MSETLPERQSQQQRAPAGRWEPVSEFEHVAERLQRMLEQTFGAAPDLRSVVREAAAWTPAVDIEEEDDAYVIEAELPGVKREDVTIELIGNELTITGEIKERERKGVLRRRTRRVGQFALALTLPDRVEADQISAELDHGVLTVRVPKAEAAQRRRIEVSSS
jgi:HSP20 family protein